MSRVVVGGLLALSVAANAYLLLTRGRKTAAPAPQPPQKSAVTGNTAPSRGPESPALPGERSDSSAEYASLSRAQLEKRLAAAETRLAKLLPIEERFEQAERSSESEARVKPFLDKVFNATGESKKAAYVVECHHRICKLTVDDALGHDWMDPLQTDPDGRGMFAGFKFGPEGTFMELEEAGRAAGLQAAFKLVMALYESKAVAECKKQHPTPGNATFELSLDVRTHRFLAEASGSLANQALGVCVRRVVEDAIASVTLPPDATLGKPIPFTVQVP